MSIQRAGAHNHLTTLPPLPPDCWLSSLDPIVGARFRHHFSIAQKTVSEGVSSGRACSSLKHYDKWLSFTHDLGLDPFLEAFQDKVPFLQVFGHLICSEELAIDGNPIRSQSVDDYIRSIAQAFLAMGSDNLHLNSAGKTDFRLARMLAAWKKEDLLRLFCSFH